MNNNIRSLMGKLIGKAKFIINAGLNELNEHNKNTAVLLLILLSLYVSAESFAPMGQPQNSPHITIKGMCSLKFAFVSFLIMPSGFENASMRNKIVLIIVYGSNVGKTENSQRLSPFSA